MNVRFVFGDEFWNRFFELVANAENRIFVLSAYIGKIDWERIYHVKKANVPVATICRDDSSFKPWGSGTSLT